MTRKILFVLAGALMMSTVAVGSAQAQKAQKAQKNVSSTATKARGADNSLPTEMKSNAKDAKVAIPVAKGGKKTRGASDCARLHVDNRTQWNIRIYVDGEMVGGVGSYGDVYGTYCGETTLRARAYFSDGDVYSWGPVSADFSYGDKTWTLRN